jgi:putative aldouronate transport system permease protein
MVKGFVSRGGFILQLVTALGGPNTSLLSFPEYFVSIYIGTELWQTVGWSSIIYLAALSGIDEGLYEAAEIDGAGKLRQVWHITIPGIMPTIIIMLILAVGGLLSVGHEKILLLYNPNIYETADVINSYVYRIGLTKMSWSYSSAVGLLNSVVNFTLVIATNALSRKYTETSLW